MYTVVGYQQARSSELGQVSDRLQTVSRQVTEMLSASARTIRDQVQTLAGDTAIARYIERQDPSARAQALAAMHLVPAQSGILTDIEVWDTAGARLLSTADGVPALMRAETADLLGLVVAADSVPAAIGRVFISHGEPGFAAAGRVTRDGRLLGFAVERRRLAESAQAMQRLRALIGSDAQILIGNSQGDLWTDFLNVQQSPPTGSRDAKGVVEYQRAGGGELLSVISNIGGSPWKLAIEFPSAIALAQPRRFLIDLTVIDAVLLILAFIVATVMSRRLTRPLTDLSNAAEAVSAGDYTRRVKIARADEFGVLGAAFNQMLGDLDLTLRELGASEQHYRLLFDSNPQPMCVYDVATLRFLAVNEGAVERYGYTRDEFLQMTIAGLRPPEGVAELLSYTAALGAAPLRAKLTRHRAKDGTLFDVEISSEALVFDGHQARLVVLNDLSERRRAEQLARTAEQRLRHAIASSGAVIYHLTVKDGHVVPQWVSENIARILGYPAVEALSPTWWLEHVHPDDRKRLLEGPGGQRFHDGARDYRLLRKDGEYRWVRDDQHMLRDIHENPVEVVGTWVDITESRGLEEQLRQAQKMEAVGRLAGGVAHDFNNLITVILAECDLGLLEAESPGGHANATLEEIRKAAMRAAILTRQLLSFSRRQLIEPTTLQLNDIVADVDQMMRRLIGEDLELTLRLAPDLGYTTADRGQIEQVIVNLVVNARDAMPAGGTLAIETMDAHLGPDYVQSTAGLAEGDYVMLAVSDTGAGMSDEVKAHLFEPFFTTKEAGKGTGLGLATCYAIVRQFNGHIAAYSEAGVGTTMRVYLPRSHTPSAADTPARGFPAADPRGTETILLVEDDVQVRRVTTRMLEKLGYTVLPTGDGEEAIELLEQRVAPVHLLLTDVVLPKMGGRILAEQVREIRPAIRVLFASGYSDDVIIQNRLLEHGILLLQKPFSSGALARKVREALAAAIE